jgi:hypothetical protein
MKDQLRQILAEQPEISRKRDLTREYLQARMLQALQEHGVFRSWIFVGGTALRFLFRLPRYSEDLDFSLSGAKDELDFAGVMAGVQRDLAGEGYAVDAKTTADKTVASAFVRFRGLLYEVGLSPHDDEVLSVKVELDTNPPQGAGTSTTVTRRHVTLNLFHHDKASLFAGKLHAVLTRKYTKGRDLYDLLWYLADRTWPEPNLSFLRNALVQTRWRGPAVTEHNWREVLSERLAQVDWKAAVRDVEPFLERPAEVALLTLDNLRSLLQP